jgi:hypothetical protein
MKKIYVAILAAVCALCMGLAFGCDSSEPNYYKLTFKELDGVTYTSEIMSGAEVRSGYEVRFKIEVDSDKLTGEPTVKANGKTLEPNADGEYSFSITEDTVVEVDGVYAISRYSVTFEEGEFRTRYTTPSGENLSGEVTVTAGESVSFKVVQSVYYVGDKNVVANTQILEPDENGVYTVSVTEKIVVTVQNLVIDSPFYQRADSGNGTASNPYKISRPIDLYSIADFVNSGFYSTFKYSYFELTDDIDLNGEQLYVIGDATTDTAFFAGHFNGNGHKISNYFIEDTIIEQATYTEVFLPYIGLFGYVMASPYGPAEIRNLTLENFNLHVDSTEFSGNSLAGGLVGFGMGLELTGCSINGDITVTANEKKNEETGEYNYTYVGGLAGVLQPYITEDYVFSSSVRSCASGVNVSVISGNVFGAGGIVAYLISADLKVPSYVLNSYSTGNIDGAIRAGGIAGTTSANTAIMNCYSLGNIAADTKLSTSITDSTAGYSYAGGIVGYLGCNSAVTHSFSIGEVTATTVNSKRYAISDAIAAALERGKVSSVSELDSYAYECYGKQGEKPSGEFYTDVLKWTETDWNFGGEYPDINFESTTAEFVVSVNFIGEGLSDGLSVNMKDTYLPMAYWNFVDDGIPEFISRGNMRSFGYFFDAALTKAVPYAFVPTCDITLYAGFADYSEIAGTYYIQDGSGIDTSITLATDGTLSYRSGARTHLSYYTYNGEKIMLYNTVLGRHAHAGYDGIDDFEAISVDGSNGVLTLKDVYMYANSAYGSLVAVKKLPDFVYGEYYTNDTSYSFYSDGTGVVTVFGDTPRSEEFMYIVSEGKVQIRTAGGSEYEATLAADGTIQSIANVSVAKLDEFAGTWEKAASVLKSYTFDGKGEWSYKYVGYGASGAEQVLESDSGTYTVSGGVATLSNGKTARFTQDGFVSLDGEMFYADNSYAGVWMNNSDGLVEITFDGLGKNGYGNATVDFGNSYEKYAVTYEAGADGTILLFYGSSAFGALKYSAADRTLSGSMYSAFTDTIKNDMKLFLYDGFKGYWVSNDTDFPSVEFNGLGNYDLEGSQNHLAVKGNVRIDGVDAGAYSVENGTLDGSFVFGGVEYALAYNEIADTVTVTGNDKTVVLKARDVWFGFDLADNAGNVYEFDGRGNISEGNGGIITVTGAVSKTYNYKIAADGSITVSADGQNGTLTVDSTNNCYVLGIGGVTVNLYVRNDFGGEWLIGKTESKTLTVGKIGADGTANGTFYGEAVQYKYERETKTLTFEYEGNKGTLSALTTTLETGETVCELKLEIGSDEGICIRGDGVDEFKGTYTAEKSVLLLDGLSESYFGNGTAILEIEGQTLTVSYYKNERGQIELSDRGKALYIFEQSANGEYVKDGKNYSLKAPNTFLYNRVVYGLTAGKPDKSKTYVFDGVSKVFDGQGNLAYSYVMKEQTEEDKLNLIVRFVFTDAKGKVYDAQLDYGDTDNTLQIFETAA